MMRRLVALLAICVISTSVYARQVVEWTRKLDTCDPQDRPIVQGSTRLIYAMNDERPDGPDSLKPHKPTQRATTSARMFESGHSQPLPPDAKHFDVLMSKANVTFFPEYPDTAYWCTGFKLPKFDKTVHIVRWEPVLQEDNIDVLHHMLVYECPSMTDADVNLQGDCGYSGADFPDRVSQCLGQTTIGAWAVGGQAMDLPIDVGLPLYPDAPRYFLIQTHYNRVDLKRRPITDSSGMRFHFTETLREKEGGVFDVGLMTDPRLSIPPHTKNFTFDVTCPAECTSRFAHPITLVSTLLHAHNIGSSLTVRHWRKGHEQPIIMTDTNYDFNFQDFESNAAGTVILPGDEIQTICRYDSSERANPTHFGLSSQEEMCLAYFVYWPRLPEKRAMCLNNFYNQAEHKDQLSYCMGNVMNVTSDQRYPLPPATCTHVAPSPDRLVPKFMNLSDFNPNVYERKAENVLAGRKFNLYWTIDQKNGEVHFAADVDTDGWFGVGLSKNGGMPGSDIMTAHVYKDANGHWVPAVTDRMSTAYAKPGKDTLQDLYDIRISYPEH